MNCKERLTIKYDGAFVPKESFTFDRNGEIRSFNDCFHTCDETDFECSECFIQKCFDRLGELEDKLENGSMIELPCKVGDRAYRVFLDGIREETVLHIQDDYVMDNMEVVRIITTEYSPYTPQYINNIIFFTKKEAKARLKELQNGN